MLWKRCRNPVSYGLQQFLCQYFRMELLHCEKLMNQKAELEKAELDSVSVTNWTQTVGNKSTHTHAHRSSHFVYSVWIILHSSLLQAEFEFSPEILKGKLAEVVYRDATGKLKGMLLLKGVSQFCQKIPYVLHLISSFQLEFTQIIWSVCSWVRKRMHWRRLAYFVKLFCWRFPPKNHLIWRKWKKLGLLN